jgi:hypothetical protein
MVGHSAVYEGWKRNKQCVISGFNSVINEDVFWDFPQLNSNLFPTFRRRLLLPPLGHYYSSTTLQMEAVSFSETSVKITNQNDVVPQENVIFINKKVGNNTAHSFSNGVLLSLLSMLLVCFIPLWP